jgi:chromosome segregation ATPase
MSDDKSSFPNSKESPDGGIESGDAAPSKQPGAKRRASRAGTRSVATLTPEQLARKHANDREAQRNIRQRTRDHIESLEQRIRDLSGDRQDDRNLEEIQRRNKELEEELKHHKTILFALEDDMGSAPLTTSSMCRWREIFLLFRADVGVI